MLLKSLSLAAWKHEPQKQDSRMDFIRKKEMEEIVMRIIGRVVLCCYKKLPCGVLDTFRVIVSEKDEGTAKEKYKSVGYEVH